MRDAEGVEKTYKAGESFTETPGEYLEIGNAGAGFGHSLGGCSASQRGETVNNERGVSTDNAPPGPTTVYKTSLAVTEPLGEFDLVQLIVDFPSGTWTPSHTHGGELLVTVLNGEQTARDAQGVETIYKAGESFTETPGEYLEIGNAGQELVTVSAVGSAPQRSDTVNNERWHQH